MPKIQYIGRTNDFSGKSLWEILGNLKNMGVGRLVFRNMHRRYPEPCFYRILQAEPLRKIEGHDRRVRVLVEKVFRGRRYPDVIEMETQTYKPDFRLVPRHEEADLWKAVEATPIPVRILPPTTEFPSLLKHMLKEEMKASAKPVVEPKLPIKFNLQGVKNYRVAQEGELPNVDIDPRKTNQPHLYEIPKTSSSS